MRINEKKEEELMERIISVLEEAGVKYDIKPDFATIEFWTDTAGQDIVSEFEYDGSAKGFVNEFTERAELYDVDEEVELFADSRGKNGVPSSIRELLDDCQEAKDTLVKLAKSLKEAV